MTVTGMKLRRGEIYSREFGGETDKAVVTPT